MEMNQKLLIVDADVQWATTLKNFLEQHHFDVTIARSAEEGKKRFVSDYPCMIILELILPQMSGEDFCKWVRQQQTTDVSIIMVSQKHAVEDKIHGLTIGADDYLTKPVDLHELLAHMQAVGIKRSRTD
ncbi:response regulator transcription factor [Lysinibacillus sp. S2017]|nr:response regulator transcription factor [Lysinibacillus sp. S2017]